MAVDWAAIREALAHRYCSGSCVCMTCRSIDYVLCHPAGGQDVVLTAEYKQVITPLLSKLLAEGPRLLSGRSGDDREDR